MLVLYLILFVSFTLIPGGIIGVFIARSWGLFKSSIGKSVFFLSAGLLSWGIGNVVWSYYNFFKNIPVPYPSLSDFGFVTSYPLWTIGMINLPHALGGKFGFKKWYSKLLIVLIPVFVLALSYYLLVFITKNNIIFTPFTSYTKLFFDIAYGTLDVILLTIALILGTSFKFFGGKYKLSIYTILIGFIFLYVADFLFSYTTSVNSYYNGGIADFFFTISLAILSFGVLGFYLKKAP